MLSRRDIFLAIASFYALFLGGKAKAEQSERSVVLTGNAVKRFEEIIATGGEITGISISYRLPAPEGRVAWGTAFLSPDRGECTYKID